MAWHALAFDVHVTLLGLLELDDLRCLKATCHAFKAITRQLLCLPSWRATSEGQRLGQVGDCTSAVNHVRPHSDHTAIHSMAMLEDGSLALLHPEMLLNSRAAGAEIVLVQDGCRCERLSVPSIYDAAALAAAGGYLYVLDDSSWKVHKLWLPVFGVAAAESITSGVLGDDDDDHQLPNQRWPARRWHMALAGDRLYIVKANVCPDACCIFVLRSGDLTSYGFSSDTSSAVSQIKIPQDGDVWNPRGVAATEEEVFVILSNGGTRIGRARMRTQRERADELRWVSQTAVHSRPSLASPNTSDRVLQSGGLHARGRTYSLHPD